MRVIQYSQSLAIKMILWGYWMPAFAGMTSESGAPTALYYAAFGSAALASA